MTEIFLCCRFVTRIKSAYLSVCLFQYLLFIPQPVQFHIVLKHWTVARLEILLRSEKNNISCQLFQLLLSMTKIEMMIIMQKSITSNAV